jgi:hypothetical protein
MNKRHTSLAALVLTAAFGLVTIAPASADQAAATRNEIFGGFALLAGIATAVNVSHKSTVAATVTGTTPEGDTVYADGHVVTAGGASYYPGNVGQSVTCDRGYCTIADNAGDRRWTQDRSYDRYYGDRYGDRNPNRGF